jgi:competence protein ComEC
VQLLPGGRRLLLDEVAIQWRPNPPAQLRVRLFTSDPPLVPGDRIRLRATIGPPSPPVAPGAYDFRRDLFFDGIAGSGLRSAGLGRLSTTAVRPANRCCIGSGAILPSFAPLSNGE